MSRELDRRSFLRAGAAGLAGGTTAGADLAAGRQASRVTTSGLVPAGDTASRASPTDASGWPYRISTTDDDVGNDVVASADDGGVFVGYTETRDTSEGWVVKVDESGAASWRARFDRSRTRVYAVVEAHDDGYVVGGLRVDDGVVRPWLAALAPDGSVRWETSLEGTGWVRGLAAFEDRYAVVGTAQLSGTQAALLAAVDADGTPRWQTTYREWDVSRGFDVAAAGDGLVFAGQAIGNRTNPWVVKLDPGGTVQWEQVDFGEAATIAFGVAATSDGGAVVAGREGSGAYDPAHVAGVGPDGDVRWSTPAEQDGTIANDVVALSDDQFEVAGRLLSETDDFDAWLAQFDGEGNQWGSRSWGTETDEVGAAVAPTEDGRFYVVVNEQTADGGIDTRLARRSAVSDDQLAVLGILGGAIALVVLGVLAFGAVLLVVLLVVAFVVLKRRGDG